MRTFTGLPPVPSDHLVPFTDQLRLAVAACLARFKGDSRYHTRARPALLPGLVCRTCPGPAGRAPPAAHPVDARSPAIQALDGVAAVLGHCPVLPHLCDGRTAGALTSRARPTALAPAGIIDAGVHPPAVRGLLTAAASHRTRAASRWPPCSVCSACGSSKPPGLARQRSPAARGRRAAGRGQPRSRARMVVVAMPD
jgi:hypothetical protein